ncbi:MAG: hypothetical protein UR73_C0038G0003 [candidate division WS6 bacterium GW2011_GWF1_35_23]|uniref:Uncharacterized protein n=1 Tax=candidate division WS6 bacterium GW2011_GWF1_35_23 TaxID=1619097 RepID=A0A0G0EH64_9BACT|nr:MAG: hypothetical protein UR73_C0038G0003 [candidate division WS6 bacterium GW2011_GWF1_35_23]KKQ29787.1 MAG: hypothetical protein US46_C0017G0003 [Candidatus Shapirobacteria bacterium GW2011_GWF2_37_20]
MANETLEFTKTAEFILGKIEGLEEARWQICYALPHIDPNRKLEKQTQHLLDAFKRVQQELKESLGERKVIQEGK